MNAIHMYHVLATCEGENMPTVRAVYRGTDRLVIPGFNITLPCVVVRGVVVYFPVRHVCRAIGVNAQRQKERLESDGRFDEDGMLEELPIQTKTGERRTLCIRKSEIAKWFTLIGPNKVGVQVRGALTKFQDALFDAADRFLWGDTSVIAPADIGAGARPAVVEGTLIIRGACPHCGGRLCVEIGPQGTHFTPLPPDDDEADE